MKASFCGFTAHCILKLTAQTHTTLLETAAVNKVHLQAAPDIHNYNYTHETEQANAPININ